MVHCCMHVLHHRCIYAHTIAKTTGSMLLLSSLLLRPELTLYVKYWCLGWRPPMNFHFFYYVLVHSVSK